MKKKGEFSQGEVFQFMCLKTGVPYLKDAVADISLLHTRTSISPDFLVKVEAIQKEYPYIDDTNVDNLNSIQGVGAVYAIAVIYLLSRRRYPIYDRFVGVAMSAIKDGKTPHSKVSPRNTEAVNKLPKAYKDYLEFIKSIAPTSYMERKVDRALWTYGHLFK